MLKKLLSARDTAERLSKDDALTMQEKTFYNRIVVNVDMADAGERLKEVLKDYHNPNFRFTGSRIEIHDIAHLKGVRDIYRAAFGTWQDKIAAIFHYSGKEMYAAYEGFYKKAAFYIDLHFDATNPPPGILKDGCRITHTPAKTFAAPSRQAERYSVICDT